MTRYKIKFTAVSSTPSTLARRRRGWALRYMRAPGPSSSSRIDFFFSGLSARSYITRAPGLSATLTCGRGCGKPLRSSRPRLPNYPYEWIFFLPGRNYGATDPRLRVYIPLVPFSRLVPLSLLTRGSFSFTSVCGRTESAFLFLFLLFFLSSFLSRTTRTRGLSRYLEYFFSLSRIRRTYLFFLDCSPVRRIRFSGVTYPSIRRIVKIRV